MWEPARQCTLISKFVITKHNLPLATPPPPPTSPHFQSHTLLWLVSSPIVSPLNLMEESLFRKYCMRACQAGFGNIFTYFLDIWSMRDLLPFAASLTTGLLPLNFVFARYKC